MCQQLSIHGLCLLLRLERSPRSWRPTSTWWWRNAAASCPWAAWRAPGPGDRCVASARPSRHSRRRRLALVVDWFSQKTVTSTSLFPPVEPGTPDKGQRTGQRSQGLKVSMTQVNNLYFRAFQTNPTPLSCSNAWRCSGTFQNSLRFSFSDTENSVKTKQAQPGPSVVSAWPRWTWFIPVHCQTENSLTFSVKCHFHSCNFSLSLSLHTSSFWWLLVSVGIKFHGCFHLFSHRCSLCIVVLIWVR